jgi:hypothetical protein
LARVRGEGLRTGRRLTFAAGLINSLAGGGGLKTFPLPALVVPPVISALSLLRMGDVHRVVPLKNLLAGSLRGVAVVVLDRREP